MFATIKERTAQITKAILGISFLMGMSAGVSATEYRLFVNDTTACRSAGVTGSVCLVPLGATTASAVTAAPSVATTQPTSASSNTGDCVVTAWNPCATGTSGNATPPATSAPAVTSTSVAPAPAAPAYVPSGSVSSGDLNYGSGGRNATGNSSRVTVSNDTTAFPFSVAPGNYAGAVDVITSSTPFPTDGTAVRVWWSKTAGGSPLSVSCAANIGRTGKLYWDQTGTLGYGCAIPNTRTTLYLNLKSCISPSTDVTCSDSKASPGSSSSLYISGSKTTL
jgi:hypothetical protein